MCSPFHQLDCHLVPHRGSADLKVVVLVGGDGNLPHQFLHLGAAHKRVGIFTETGAPRDNRSAHRKLHAELGFKTRLRRMIRQDQGVRLVIATVFRGCIGCFASSSRMPSSARSVQ